ncbi:MAG: hypothetical protein II863_16530 [Kiritimatiellae bacterium]|nr:hypothetical protein [Kiritimatiellia bacterium]
MKYIATVLCMFCAASASAAARLSVGAMPEPVRPLAEAETNVVFSSGAQGDNIWKLSIELESSVSNCVEVVFGTDANNDGVLGVCEGEVCIGWDCGEWFWRDRRSGEVGSVECASGSRRLDWALRLNADRSARSIGGNVFSGMAAPTCFNPDWNLARVVSRGTESLRVESKVTVDALLLRIR